MADFIKKDGSLTSQGVTAYVQAMLNDKVNELPVSLYKHVQNSPQCIATVAEAYDWVVDSEDEDDWKEAL